MSVNAALGRLKLGDHVCCPINGTEQSWAVAAASTTRGLRDGHKVLFFVDDPDGLRRFLARQVRGAERAMVTGQLQVRSGAGTDVGDCGFDVDKASDILEAEIELAARQGFAGVRSSGDLLSVVARGRREANADAVVEYERRVNAIFVAGCVIGICHYDPRDFDAATWHRILSAHPSTMLPAEDESLVRLHGARITAGIRLTGTVDLVNRDALPALLADVVRLPGACRIDASGLEFADAHAIGCLLRTATARAGRQTTIVCTTHLATLLRLCGAAGVPGLTVTECG
jgi:MEDS: MEthanogen/methylotroph, DcmR Sensory domain/STAS domain